MASDVFLLKKTDPAGKTICVFLGLCTIPRKGLHYHQLADGWQTSRLFPKSNRKSLSQLIETKYFQNKSNCIGRTLGRHFGFEESFILTNPLTVTMRKVSSSLAQCPGQQISFKRQSLHYHHGRRMEGKQTAMSMSLALFSFFALSTDRQGSNHQPKHNHQQSTNSWMQQ